MIHSLLFPLPNIQSSIFQMEIVCVTALSGICVHCEYFYFWLLNYKDMLQEKKVPLHRCVEQAVSMLFGSMEAWEQVCEYVKKVTGTTGKIQEGSGCFLCLCWLISVWATTWLSGELTLFSALSWSDSETIFLFITIQLDKNININIKKTNEKCLVQQQFQHQGNVDSGEWRKMFY